MGKLFAQRMLRLTYGRCYANNWRRSCARELSSSEQEDEVEKKFSPSPTLLSMLPLLATPKKQVFTDCYYDTAGLHLTTRDMWFRRRNLTFELKWPIVSKAGAIDNDASGLEGVDFYHETTDWPTIDQALGDVAGVNLGRPLPLNDASKDHFTLAQTDGFLSSAGLSPFAMLRTSRLRYAVSLPVHLKSNVPAESDQHRHRLHVDIDTVTFLPPTTTLAEIELDSVLSGGIKARDLYVDADAMLASAQLPNTYMLGEIELVQAGGGLSASLALKDVFQQLMIDPAPTRGKVLEYLFRQRPQHYQALTDCGLIAAKMRS